MAAVTPLPLVASEASTKSTTSTESKDNVPLKKKKRAIDHRRPNC